MKIIRLVVWCICAAPLVISAQELHPRLGAKANLPPQPDGRTTHAPSITAAEWSDVEKWMRENCPNRLEFLNRMSDKPELQQRAKQLIAERYRVLTHTGYQPLHDSLVLEAQVQDQIFGAQIKFREAPHRSERRKQARLELQAAVGKLVDAEMQVRNARIGRLQGEVKKLQENKPELVRQWTMNMLRAIHDPGSTDGAGGDDATISEPSSLPSVPE
jgi:hypothetical protein